MTRVWYDEKGDTLRLFISGHAGFNSNGGDIVCAAASALGFALLGFLEQRDNGGEIDCDWLVESGRLDITATRNAETDIAFEMTMIGLCQLERKYPDNVRVTIGSPQG